jgi:dTDP-4-dehydrorhamnose 3,5-epimerase
MRFTETKLKGAFILDLEERHDRRGFFARSFCTAEFRAHGLKPTVAQCNLALTHQQGAMRGLHYQVAPATEAKLMRCIRGAIYDVIVDLRPDSPTYLEHIGVELSAENRRSLYVPELFAHGYQTLTDNAEILCHVSEPYTPGCERGLRYDDPILGIEWRLPVSEISEKDAAWELLETRKLGV